MEDKENVIDSSPNRNKRNDGQIKWLSYSQEDEIETIIENKGII